MSDSRRVLVTMFAAFAVFATFVAFGALFMACVPSTSTRVCNGHAELCDKPFDRVAFAGSHNAMSNIRDDFAAPNQREGLAAQLDLGVRAFLIDTHVDENGDAAFCHTSCVIGEIPIADGLATFKAFLDAHPTEIVQLMVEDYITTEQWESAIERAGLVDDVIVHDPGTPWPTLGELVDGGERLFITMEHSSPPPAWNHAMYLEYVDTPFSFHTLADLAADASCDKLRGSDDNALFLVNHWVEDPLPDEALSKTVNAHDVLLERVRRCEAKRAHVANVVAVDYVSSGDVFEVVDELNGF